MAITAIRPRAGWHHIDGPTGIQQPMVGWRADSSDTPPPVPTGAITSVLGGVVQEAEAFQPIAGEISSVLGGVVQQAQAGQGNSITSILGGVTQEAVAGQPGEGAITSVLGAVVAEGFAEPGVPGRVTQLTRLIATEVDAAARATQLARLVLSEITVPGRITQLTRLVVEEIEVELRTTQLVRLMIAEAVPCVTQWQQLWIIKRRDGVIFRYTSLDVDFTWGDHVYKSCGSLNPSAAEESSAIGQVANVELAGIFKDDGITEAAIYGGLFDDAFVQVWLVAVVGTESPRRLAAGWTGNISHGEKGFTMEVVGPGARLDQQALVQQFTPSCRWVFGSAQCGIDREALKATGTVIHAANRRRFTADLVLASSDVRWANGLVRWTSGENAGIECEVKEVTFGSDSEVELWELPGFEPEVGDTFDLLPGCDLSAGTCKAVYGNLINFGGFPDVPGQDDVVKTPDAKLV